MAGFDEVLGGGFPEYSLNLIVGGPGSGKTTLGNQIAFANAGAERKALFFTVIGEPPLKMLRYMQQLSFFDPSKVEESIRFVHVGQEVQQGGLSPVLERIIKEVDDVELALAPTFREDFRESLYRMVGALTGMGVTVMSTVELPDAFSVLQFSPHGTAFLNDAIIMQRYVELGGAAQARLGLYIACEIVRAHGGTLNVQSADGVTTVALRVRRAVSV